MARENESEHIDEEDRVLAQLLPCALCGAGETQARVHRLAPMMSGGPGALISVSIQHWCETPTGPGLRRSISSQGRDFDDAIRSWNERTT